MSSYLTNPWTVHDRLGVAPILGKLLSENLHKTEEDVIEERVNFGPYPNQTVLIFYPAKATERRRSLVYFIHGGGWYSGNPQIYRFVGHFFAEMGYPTLLAGYRLAPMFHFPAQVDDVCAGLDIGMRVLSVHGITVDRVIAGGHSAGAELAALLIYDRSRRGCSSVTYEKFGGYFSISGPISFADCTIPELRGMIASYIGNPNPDNWDAADPIKFIHGDETTPALIVHGDQDPLVDLENALAFARRLSSSGTCPVEVYLVPGGHHANLAVMFVEDQPATRVLRRWLRLCEDPAAPIPPDLMDPEAPPDH